MDETIQRPPPDFRILFESAPDLYLVLDPRLVIVGLSNAYARATMTRRENILSRELFAVFPDNPGDPASAGVRNLHASLRRVLKTGKPDAMPVQKYDIRRPDEEGGGFEERYWSPLNTPVLNPDGALAYIIHRVEDVTEFMRLRQQGAEQDRLNEALREQASRAEAEIYARNREVAAASAQLKAANDELSHLYERERGSSARTQAMFDSVADGIITISERGVIESFNPSAEKMFGYAAAEVVGRNINMLMGEPFHSEHDGYLRRYLEGGGGAVVGKEREVQALRKDGSGFPLNLLVNEMGLGGQRHFIGVVRDITARKSAEQQLNAFFALSLDMLCISSVDGYFKRVNPAFSRALGWSEAEMLSHPFMYFVHPDDAAATQRAVQRQVDAGESVMHFENRYRHKDGSWRTLSWVSAPHPGGLMFATARDVTEARTIERDLFAAKEKAEFANRAKDSFLATMSHEIRTPLTGMLGMLELLSLTRLDSEQRATLDAAWESARGLLRIVSDILDWSKIEEGKLELSLRATSIPNLLTDVVNTYSRVASTRELVLRQYADPQLSPAHVADPLRLSQVLNNFVSNALKFTQRGEVELRADLVRRHESGETIRFSVRDTGAGIPKEIQAQLFQRFRQETPDTARMYGGTGLGLAICRRLAELMDGQVALESAPGRGSTFSITLTLPISGAPGETLPSLHPEVEQRNVTPLVAAGTAAPLVLAVDDNPVNRNLLAKQLEVLGLRVQTAENGERALEMWQRGGYAAVITDCHMPEMDGYMLTRAIRRMERDMRLARTPVIAWTANALADESDRCKAAGMDELLVKPTGLPQLKAMLAKCLVIGDPAGGGAESRALPGVASAAGSGPIDFTVLSLSVPDASQHMDVLRDFRASIVKDHARLLDLLEQRNLVEVERAAHRMKGSSRMVGAHDLAEACAALEASARRGESMHPAEAKRAVDDAVTQIEHYLDNMEKTGE
ncbi:MAG TPA: PAS domain S-box protein [Gallionellaceae bacterium]|nr:PAS domain S-box protein [Gallionellaceae bacterium]